MARMAQRVCTASWQPIVVNCPATLEVSSTVNFRVAMIELTTLAFVSFRHSPLQVLRSFFFPLPLYNRVRVVICHSSSSIYPSQQCLMIWAVYDRAFLGKAFSMSDVTPVVHGAVPDFISIMALGTSSSEMGWERASLVSSSISNDDSSLRTVGSGAM
jgi:hypothetical protein